MEEFLDKILPFLLVFGLIASNAVNGGPLQEKMKKGKISNCSSQLKAYIRLYLWLNRNQKRPILKSVKPYLIGDCLFMSIAEELSIIIFVDFCKHLYKQSPANSFLEELPLVTLLREKLAVFTL